MFEKIRKKIGLKTSAEKTSAKKTIETEYYIQLKEYLEQPISDQEWFDYINIFADEFNINIFKGNKISMMNAAMGQIFANSNAIKMFVNDFSHPVFNEFSNALMQLHNSLKVKSFPIQIVVKKPDLYTCKFSSIMINNAKTEPGIDIRIATSEMLSFIKTQQKECEENIEFITGGNTQFLLISNIPDQETSAMFSFNNKLITEKLNTCIDQFWKDCKQFN